MSKILFIADIHIKLNTKNIPDSWIRNRFCMFLEQLLEMQEKADVLIIGGDVFDRVPSIPEIELYFQLLNSCAIPTYIYSGNHEAVKKDTTFLSNLKDVTQDVNYRVQIIDDFISTGEFDMLPYNKLKSKEFPEPVSRILCTHVRGEIPPHVKPEIDLDKLAGWDVVLAGDLHSYSNSQRNILYPGSPYTITFHRQPVSTGAILLDSTTLEHEWLEFNLPQLIRKTISASETPIADEFHHVVYEVEGTIVELSNMKDNDLIDKKVSKRVLDTALILAPNLTILEEVNEYLLYILQLDSAEVATVLKELHGHLGKIDL